MKSFTRFLLFGNYFYGICAIALSIEAAMQQFVALNSIPYYLFVFVATVLYYTHAYIAEPSGDVANKRSIWYYENKVWITRSQLLLTIILISLAIYLFRENWNGIKQASLLEWVLIGIFPLVATLYYGSVKPERATHSLRNNGWLKPFVIGFVWAGAVTVYPIIFNNIERQTIYTPHLVGFLLFIKNFMFITMLCIMFDFKDYAADHNRQLKTFVVEYGLRRTIFHIIIPLSVIGLGTFIMYGIFRQFS